MSGAAALAAARRRRAGPSNAPPSGAQLQGRPQPPPPAPTGLRRPTEPGQDGENGVPIPQKINPTTMLISHNRIIDNLQTVTENINNTLESDIADRNEVKKLINSAIDEAIANLKIADNNIEFFKNKYNKMETQLSELKKHIIKVQTFAMETNLQCIELKKMFFKEPQKFKTLDQVAKSDPHKLNISQETQQEHINQVAHNTQINDYISNNDNQIIA